MGVNMQLYTMIGSGVDTTEAASLRARLTAWHDAMVAHERRLRAGNATDRCDDECPHAEARLLWPEAQTLFGARAQELTFLRSRATRSLRRQPSGDSAAATSTTARAVES
jgi:hypothetical protein